MEWLHFLNLQYWYCIIYSFFGGRCAFLEEVVPASPSEQKTVLEQFFEFVVSAGGTMGEIVGGIISLVWSVYSALAWGVSTFLIFLLLSALLGLVYIRFRELKTYSTVAPRPREESAQRTQWQELLESAKSSDPKRWREAILEADRMLGELLGGLGYDGLNTGEKMQRLPENAFVTVPVAWEAHRMRNFVSQGSSNFVLTQREAFRIMKLYEQVFEEFRFL